MIERKVGEVFEAYGVKYKVIEGRGCDDCAICDCFIGEIAEVLGECDDFDRLDGKSVHFKKI
jgi:hypothetical protein